MIALEWNKSETFLPPHCILVLRQPLFDLDLVSHHILEASEPGTRSDLDK
jgi:hypothetical protein